MIHLLSGAAARRLLGVVRAAAVTATACLLVSCGGGGTTPVTGVALRPLSPEFSYRKAVAYSPYRTATNSDGLAAEVIPPGNILQDMNLLLAAGFRQIRLFDSDDKVGRQTLQVIRDNQLNMKVQLGVYLQSGNDAFNQAQLARQVALANEFKDIVLAVSVGNENMVSWSPNPISPDVMAGYIATVRRQVTQPITADDNYAFWAAAPLSITNVVDFVSLHTYTELDTVYNPNLWDWRQQGVPEAQRAAAMMDASVAEARRQYGLARTFLDSRGLAAMPITIGETGWNAVNLGLLSYRAHPVNQKMYLDRLAAWAAEGAAGNGPKAVFWFEAFDEPWKQGDDKWGLFNAQRQARYAVQAINAPSSFWVWEPGTYTDADALYFVAPVVGVPVSATTYTLYADTAVAGEARASGLFWDAFDGVTAAYPEVASDYAPGDAIHSLLVTPQPAGYGWGLLLQSHSGVTDNLTSFADSGSLQFWIRTTYPGKIEIGIATDTALHIGQEAYLQIQGGDYGYCNTGAWCEVTIPIKDFVAVNPSLDLSLVTSRFVIADRYAYTGKPAGSGITTPLSVDAIRWVR